MNSPLSKYLLAPATLAIFFSVSSIFGDQPGRETKAETSQDVLYANKKPAKEYWAQFKQDDNQAWKDSRSAFRDGWVEGKLDAALRINEYLGLYNIGINVDKGTAVLTGEVSSEIERELAESVALGIEGIDFVDNRLAVNSSLAKKTEEEDEEEPWKGPRNFSQYMLDVSTTAAVKNELLKSPNVNGMAIDVETYNDRVTLSGTVKTRQEREVAEAIAHKLQGVKKVVNNLEVAT